MMYRIHFTLADGSEDFVTVSGGSIEAIRARADAEIAKRGGRDPWSEEVR